MMSQDDVTKVFKKTAMYNLLFLETDKSEKKD